jgi:hypothetical protein
MGADAVFLDNTGEYTAGSVIMPQQSTTTTTGMISVPRLVQRATQCSGQQLPFQSRAKSSLPLQSFTNSKPGWWCWSNKS